MLNRLLTSMVDRPLKARVTGLGDRAIGGQLSVGCPLMRVMPEGCERGRVGQSLWEASHIGRQVWVQESVEMIGAHFLNRCLWLPSIEYNPVYRDKHPASISA